MLDYTTAATELKARLDAKTKKAADLDAFFEAVRASLMAEMEKANSALAYETAPVIEYTAGWPTGATIELVLAGATCQVCLQSIAPNDTKPPTLAANIVCETGEKPVTFLLLLDQSPIQAQRVSLTPQSEPKLNPPELAAAIVYELITGAP